MIAKVSALVVLLGAVATAPAHPAVGIVEDSRGNVFFTDTQQVWKITAGGKMSVAVPNVHTHELCLDAEDSLYGEHLWYEGDATRQWGHRVWCLKRDGALSDVIPSRAGFLRDYSFVRDRAGNMYWATTGEMAVINKRSADGKIVTHATADFRGVRWMTATPEGALFLIDAGDLRRVSADGKVTTVAARVTGRKRPPAKVSQRHYHMGLWTGKDASVYVAVAAERLVLRVLADGRTSVAARSGGSWSPAGGMIDRGGDMWLLEYGSANAVRVRRIGRDGHQRVYATADPAARRTLAR